MKNKEQREKIQNLIRNRIYNYIDAWVYGTPQERWIEVRRRISDFKKSLGCSTTVAIHELMAHDGAFRFGIAVYGDIKSIYNEAALTMPMDTFVKNFNNMCLSELERMYNEYEDADGETAY